MVGEGSSVFSFLPELEHNCLLGKWLPKGVNIGVCVKSLLAVSTEAV